MSSVTAQTVKNLLQSWKGFDKIMQVVKITSAENGKCTAEMKVAPEHTNCFGGLHGGFSASLVDVISSLAVLTDKQGPSASVSVNMNLTYLKGASLGDEIVINAETLKAGKNLAFLEVEIKNKCTGDLLVKGSHTKYVLNK